MLSYRLWGKKIRTTSVQEFLAFGCLRCNICNVAKFYIQNWRRAVFRVEKAINKYEVADKARDGSLGS